MLDSGLQKCRVICRATSDPIASGMLLSFSLSLLFFSPIILCDELSIGITDAKPRLLPVRNFSRSSMLRLETMNHWAPAGLDDGLMESPETSRFRLTVQHRNASFSSSTVPKGCSASPGAMVLDENVAVERMWCSISSEGGPSAHCLSNLGRFVKTKTEASSYAATERTFS